MMPATGRVLPTRTAQQPRSMASSQGGQARPAASPVVTVATVEAQPNRLEVLIEQVEEKPDRHEVQGVLTDPLEKKPHRLATRAVLTDPVEEKAHRLAAQAPEGVKVPLVVRVMEGSKGTRANAGK